MEPISCRTIYDDDEWVRIRNCGKRLQDEFDGKPLSYVCRRIESETGIPISRFAVRATCDSAGYEPRNKVIHRRSKDVDKLEQVEEEPLSPIPGGLFDQAQES